MKNENDPRNDQNDALEQNDAIEPSQHERLCEPSHPVRGEVPAQVTPEGPQ